MDSIDIYVVESNLFCRKYGQTLFSEKKYRFFDTEKNMWYSKWVINFFYMSETLSTLEQWDKTKEISRITEEYFADADNRVQFSEYIRTLGSRTSLGEVLRTVGSRPTIESVSALQESVNNLILLYKKNPNNKITFSITPINGNLDKATLYNLHTIYEYLEKVAITKESVNSLQDDRKGPTYFSQNPRLMITHETKPISYDMIGRLATDSVARPLNAMGFSLPFNGTDTVEIYGGSPWTKEDIDRHNAIVEQKKAEKIAQNTAERERQIAEEIELKKPLKDRFVWDSYARLSEHIKFDDNILISNVSIMERLEAMTVGFIRTFLRLGWTVYGLNSLVNGNNLIVNTPWYGSPREAIAGRAKGIVDPERLAKQTLSRIALGHGDDMESLARDLTRWLSQTIQSIPKNLQHLLTGIISPFIYAWKGFYRSATEWYSYYTGMDTKDNNSIIVGAGFWAREAGIYDNEYSRSLALDKLDIASIDYTGNTLTITHKDPTKPPTVRTIAKKDVWQTEAYLREYPQSTIKLGEIPREKRNEAHWKNLMNPSEQIEFEKRVSITYNDKYSQDRITMKCTPPFSIPRANAGMESYTEFGIDAIYSISRASFQNNTLTITRKTPTWKEESTTYKIQ
jgi:hypothetical protein